VCSSFHSLLRESLHRPTLQCNLSRQEEESRGVSPFFRFCTHPTCRFGLVVSCSQLSCIRFQKLGNVLATCLIHRDPSPEDDMRQALGSQRPPHRSPALRDGMSFADSTSPANQVCMAGWLWSLLRKPFQTSVSQVAHRESRVTSPEGKLQEGASSVGVPELFSFKGIKGQNVIAHFDHGDPIAAVTNPQPNHPNPGKSQDSSSHALTYRPALPHQALSPSQAPSAMRCGPPLL
jgi:hypothetical protein